MLHTHMHTYTHTHTHTHTHTVFSLVVSQGDSDSSQLESGAISAEASEVTLTDALETSPGKSPLEPPSWRSHANTDRDVLEDVSFFES